MGDDGAECAKFSVLPSLYFAAEAARGNTDMQRIKDGFRAMFGIDFDTFMLLDLPGTPNDSAQQIRNADKYALYNDCLAGLLDPILSRTPPQFAACGKQLAAVDKNTEYGYLFETMKQQIFWFCLGTKGDTSAPPPPRPPPPPPLVGEYESLGAGRRLLLRVPPAVDDREQAAWLRRAGHPHRRACVSGPSRPRASAGLSGRQNPAVDELEETLLDPFGRGTDYKEEAVNFNLWKQNASANVI